jgi:hypothetical protein
MMLERIVYVSRAAPATGLPELCRIVGEAHRLNPGAGVTGALVCLDGWFAQALEGPAAGLDAVFARIRRDPRHAGLEPRLREAGPCRRFPGQAMALRTGADLDQRLRAAFGYRPGFPAAAFPAALLLEFLVAACRRHPGVGPAPGRAGAAGSVERFDLLGAGRPGTAG